MKRALICGVSGQDGSYLARLLLNKGYEVYGSSRDAQASAFSNLVRTGVRERVTLVSMALNDFRSVLQVMSRVKPDEVYNLAGQSSVGLSFEQPVETMESIGIATLNLLEAIRFTGAATRFYNAGSGESFGDARGEVCTEDTPFRPRSPYAVAKAASCWEVATYRDAYALFACTGILFNHESPLRAERFVTKKIIAAATRIARGSGEKLRLGNLAVARDWGWAPEYVEAMWMMLQRERAEDFVIATGETHTLQEFVELAFGQLGHDWHEHVEIDPDISRPSELMANRADPSKAHSVLGWRATTMMSGVVEKMIAADRESA